METLNFDAFQRDESGTELKYKTTGFTGSWVPQLILSKLLKDQHLFGPVTSSHLWFSHFLQDESSIIIYHDLPHFYFLVRHVLKPYVCHLLLPNAAVACIWISWLVVIKSVTQMSGQSVSVDPCRFYCSLIWWSLTRGATSGGCCQAKLLGRHFGNYTL